MKLKEKVENYNRGKSLNPYLPSCDKSHTLKNICQLKTTKFEIFTKILIQDF